PRPSAGRLGLPDHRRRRHVHRLAGDRRGGRDRRGKRAGRDLVGQGRARAALRLAQGDHGREEEAARLGRGTLPSAGAARRARVVDLAATAAAGPAARRNAPGGGARSRTAPTRGSQGHLMGAILVLFERREGKVKPAGLQALSLAARLAGGDAVAALALGAGAADAAAEAGAHGARQLLVAEDAAFDAFAVEAHAAALVAGAKQVSADTILVPGTTLGRDVAARAAARLDTGLLSDVVEL